MLSQTNAGAHVGAQARGGTGTGGQGASTSPVSDVLSEVDHADEPGRWAGTRDRVVATNGPTGLPAYRAGPSKDGASRRQPTKATIPVTGLVRPDSVGDAEAHPVIVSGPYQGQAPGNDSDQAVDALVASAQWEATGNKLVPQRPPGRGAQNPNGFPRQRRFRSATDTALVRMGSSSRKLKFGGNQFSPGAIAGAGRFGRPRRHAFARRPHGRPAVPVSARERQRDAQVASAYGATPGGTSKRPAHHRRRRTVGDDPGSTAPRVGFGHGHMHRPSHKQPPLSLFSPGNAPEFNGQDGHLSFNTTMVGTPSGFVARKAFFAGSQGRASDNDAGLLRTAIQRAQEPSPIPVHSSDTSRVEEPDTAPAFGVPSSPGAGADSGRSAGEMFAAFLRKGGVDSGAVG